MYFALSQTANADNVVDSLLKAAVFQTTPGSTNPCYAFNNDL